MIAGTGGNVLQNPTVRLRLPKAAEAFFFGDGRSRTGTSGVTG
jgi:hypothetical protein